MEGNAMREIRISKVTLNIGAGEAGQKLENARALLGMISGKKTVVTAAKVRNPLFKIKKGDPIGAKVTLRGKEALDVLERAFKAVDRALPETVFDKSGNFSFGVKEYIDFPGIKYDPKIGIIGFDVCVTLGRRGARTSRRRRSKSLVGKKHRISREDGMAFVQGMNVKVEKR
jgi:large subunit ribosomal protein L5